MPTTDIKASIDNGAVDPKEVAAIERSLKAREQAPTVLEQSGTYIDWKNVRDQLGQPHIMGRRPALRKLDEIRRDPMIAFGLHYRKTPLVRAEYHIEAVDKDGPNAQIAGFMDAAWRQIHARYIFQHTQDFDYGFASIVKRFMLGNPGGTYFDPEEENPENQMKPVWDEGSVDPIIWKPFVGLPPAQVQPAFNNDGEFDGILYELSAAQQGGRGVGFKAKSTKGNDRERVIDVYHSLWATNDKDGEYGSIFGWPLIAHAYRFWWSYWYLWANLDRAFERMAVPPLVAYHPEGDYVDPDDPSQKIPYWEIALEAAERLRSNAIAAVPSTLATAGLDERGTQMREWEFRFLETPVQNFDAIGQHLSYLDVMKLRAIWVPEQAFIEGEGGTSSRNVAAQMAEIFMESQANKWEEIADHVNRYIFPQLLAVNFPEFVNNGGRVKIIGHGFKKEDVEFLKQIIQLAGQGDPAILEVDFREALKRIGAPLKSPTQLAAERNKIAQEQAAGGPPLVAPAPGQVGTIPNPGFTNGGSVPEPAGSVTGFSDQPFIYINPRAVIELSEHDDFLASLPATSHYKDKTMRALSVQLRKVWLAHLREMYPDFAKYVAKQKIELSDNMPDDADQLDEGLGADMTLDEAKQFPTVESFMLASKHTTRRKAIRAANKLLAEWGASSTRLRQLEGQSRTVIEKMLKRSMTLQAKSKGIKITEDQQDRFNAYLDNQVAKLIKSVERTTKKNIRAKLVNAIMEGKSADMIGRDIAEHFDEFPEYRADRIARSETRDAWNAGTLIAAQAGGLRYVKAKDAQHGPTDEMCEARDGTLYTVREAWREMGPSRTHPNDTLEFEPVARAEFSVQSVNELPAEAPEGSEAWFDAATCTAYVPLALSDDDTKQFLDAVTEAIA
jgi:hypothetical protein